MATPKGLSEPHLLLASGNSRKLVRNLSHILAPGEIQKIEAEIDSNVLALFALGMGHYNFATSIGVSEWRQNISRLYYAAYNIKRAVTLKHDGGFSTDSSDHSKIDGIPDGFENSSTYKSRLKSLRDDRNLCDYNHLANEVDLLYSVSETRILVSGFVQDAVRFLQDKGVAI